MNRSSLFAMAIAVVIALASPVLMAVSYQPLDEPYIGEVTGNRVFVRCGDSTSYYVVVRLDAGNNVKVLGSSGAWLAIAPPADVFSLISQQHVTAEGEIGTVTGENVRVRAGSVEFPSLYSTVQTRLDTGAKVKIIGETRNKEFYQIVPPEGIVLYISSAYVKKTDKPLELVSPKSSIAAAMAAEDKPDMPQPVTAEKTADQPSAAAAATPAGQTPAAAQTPAESAAAAEVAEVAEAPAEVKVELTAEQKLAAAIAAFDAAEEVLMAEYKKPESKRDLPAMLKLYKSLDSVGEKALAARIDYRVRYIELAIQRRSGAKQVDTIASQLKNQMARLEAMMNSLESIEARKISRDMTLIGRLKPSSVYTGFGGTARRWLLLDDLTGDRMAYVEAAKSDVNLAGNVKWKVVVIGTPKYSREIREYVVMATYVKKMAGGDPDKAPEPKDNQTAASIAMPGPKPWPAPDLTKAVEIKDDPLINPPVKPAEGEKANKTAGEAKSADQAAEKTDAKATPAAPVLDKDGKPVELPDSDAAPKDAPTTGLEMVPDTKAPAGEVNPDEFK